MSHELKEGVCLSLIEGPAKDGWCLHYKAGESGVTRIIVAEQPGQMAMVPWARVEFESAEPHLVNLALMEWVQLFETEES